VFGDAFAKANRAGIARTFVRRVSFALSFRVPHPPGTRKTDMIIEEIYDALIEAGASEEKARAARAMTNYETRISKIESDINLLKWMVGFNLAMTVAILFRVFSS